MKAIKNLLFGIIGLMFILVPLVSLIDDHEYNIVNVIVGIVVGVFFIYPLFKKEEVTDVEKFIDEEKIISVIWWKRFSAFFIDFIVVIFIYSIVISLINKLYDIRLDKVFNSNLVFAPFIILYYTIQEYLFHSTIGKLLFKLEVVSADSNSFTDNETRHHSYPTFYQVFIRSITRIIPFNVFFFLSKRPVGLHDILSKTVVTRQKTKEVPKPKIKNRLTRKQAIDKLKEAQDLMGLGLMSKEEFEALKDELTPIIMNKK